MWIVSSSQTLVNYITIQSIALYLEQFKDNAFIISLLSRLIIIGNIYKKTLSCFKTKFI